MTVNLLGPRLLPYVLSAGFLGAGALVGLVVATGNLIMIALVVGGLAGVLLLNALPIAVWMLLIGVFLVNGPVAYFYPGLAKIAWLFSLLGVFMSGAALLYAIAGRERPVRPMPAFVHLALAFAAFAVVTALFSDGPVSEIGAGAKRQFQFWGVVFLFALVPFSSAHVKRWLMFLLGVAIVQFPFALYQRVVLVPQVMGFEAPGFVPFDIVVGSFEGSIFGGGASSIMALFLVVAAITLFAAYRERLIGAGRFLLLLVVTMLPLGLGETKVVLMLIPVVVLFAFYDSVVKRPLAFAAGMLMTILIAGVLGYLYFMVQIAGTTTFRESFEATFAYNFGERGYYGTGVNRLTAIPYWFESQSWSNPLHTLFGHGVGSSYGVDGRAPQMGHMFVAHPGVHIDLVAVSLMLWDFGLVGTLLFLAVLIGATVKASQCLRTAVTAWDRTLCRVLLASLGATILMMFYSASVVVLVSHSFIVALTLGLVAWRARHGPLAVSKDDPIARPAGKKGDGWNNGRRGRSMFPQPPVGFPVRPIPGFGSPVRAQFGSGSGDFNSRGEVYRATARRDATPTGPATSAGSPPPRQRPAPDSRGRIEPIIDTFN